MLRISKTFTASWLAVTSVLLAALVGCSRETGPEPIEPDLGSLEQRVRERWDAKIARDFGKVWEYSTPNSRRVFPKSMYRLNFSYALDWELTSVEVVHYDADAAVASVAVGVMSIPTKQTSAASRLIGATPVSYREQWIFIDGEWWHSANN